jgi:hypothetical protein
MIHYRSTLVIEKTPEQVLFLLPNYYCNEHPQEDKNEVYGFRYKTQNSFFTVDTLLLISPYADKTIASMTSIAETRYWLLKLLLPLAKGYFVARQYYDLAYLKRRIEHYDA